MKTPRQAYKESFWIGAKGGLIDQKHVKAMGDSVWLFLYLLRGQTGVNEWGEGVFQYGHPVTLVEIASDFGGVSIRTIQRWISVLKRTGYISTDSHSSHGMTFWIAKAKDKTKKPRTQNASNAPASASNTKTPYAECVSSPKNSIREPRTEFQNSIRDSVTESLQTVENAPLAVPIPKGFIPKSLSNYNKDAAAKTAAGDCSFLKEEKQPPRQPLSLQEQIEEVKRRGLWKSPGKVVELQPKEATA